MKKRQSTYERAVTKLKELSVPYEVIENASAIRIEGESIKVLFFPSKNTFTTNTGKQGRSLQTAITVAGYEYNQKPKGKI